VLNQVADGVWVRQSEWVSTNSIALRGEDGYETALDRLSEAASDVDVVVPGHGAVAEGPEAAARIAADRAYIDALRREEEPVDARLDADWLSGPHQSNLEQVRGR
jgi:hypothetical protein